jgi:KDO2-lipid IV(A) lauroyltransferase
MRQRSAIRNWTEYGLALCLLKPLEWAPPGLAHWLARRYTRLLDLALPRFRRIAERNLSLAMPHLDARSRAAIIDGVFGSIARMLVSFARFPAMTRENIGCWIRCEGGEHFDCAIREGRGVLFATAHLGNWELSAYAHALLTAPMNVVVRPLDNPLLDALVERRRGLSGNRLISKRDIARPILKALAANEAVGVLIDQNVAADSGVFVDFFGVPACTSAGFAKLAARSGAVVIPGFALWSEVERRYILRFYEPVPIRGDAVADTQAIQTRLEQVIRAHPDQWLWIHRRWKTRPAGAPALYADSQTRPKVV